MPTPTDALAERATRARRFPANTCGASRHAQDVAEAMMRREVYPEVTEDPPHIGASILATVEALYEARATIDRLQAENQALRAEVRGYALQELSDSGQALAQAMKDHP